MAVDIHGGADAGVSQALADDLRVNISLEHKGSMGTAQVVKADFPEPGQVRNSPEPRRKLIRVQGFPPLVA